RESRIAPGIAEQAVRDSDYHQRRDAAAAQPPLPPPPARRRHRQRQDAGRRHFRSDLPAAGRRRGTGMKQSILLIALVAFASPAHAQLGGLLNKAQQVKDAKSKFDDLNVTEEEERKIGEDVSAKIRQRFGVVQSAPIHKYVTLVGLTLARESERPALGWKFVVLDTDGVNAFASPGGIVHITRGALGLIRNEAELAGVLAHEIVHIARKHTVNAIKKSKAFQLGTSETMSSRGLFLDKLANKAYEMVLENKFDRGDEMDADKVSVSLTDKAGYAPGTLAVFLNRLDERNKDQPAQNG